MLFYHAIFITEFKYTFICYFRWGSLLQIRIVQDCLQYLLGCSVHSESPRLLLATAYSLLVQSQSVSKCYKSNFSRPWYEHLEFQVAILLAIFFKLVFYSICHYFCSRHFSSYEALSARECTIQKHSSAGAMVQSFLL